ncbi:hypothetical protein GCM10009077_05880 [Roseibium denhamense]|nr:transporter substrate-binding domain-containing protein [Roseibium denhamense]
MKVLKTCHVAAFAAACFFASLAQASDLDAPREKVIAYTGYLPPLSINEAEKGITVELMELVAEEAGIDLEIRYAPWKRAQILAEKTSGSLLFALASTRERRSRFHYIAPLIYTESVFVTLERQINTAEEAKTAVRPIGVHLGSQRSRILKRHGVSNISEVATAEQLAAMLYAGRIDAWYTMRVRANYTAKTLGFDPKALVAGAPLSHGIQWLAANKDVSPEMRARYSAAVSKVWRNPRYWQIVDKYAE